MSSRVVVLDTSMESDNDGDRIIVDAIEREFPELITAARVPTHRFLTRSERALVRRAELLIVTGTNILSSRLWQPRQWFLTPADWFAMRAKVVFLGVGWRQYQNHPDLLTRVLLRGMSHRHVPLSARDGYTADRLNGIGVAALNTNCPTMWSLESPRPQLSAQGSVLFTVTDYKRSVEHDQILLNRLANVYSEVRIWPQGDGDEKYLAELALPVNAQVLPRGLGSLEEGLRDSEYVGTRLHAGVRAAQLGRPSAVLAVDNRALEIGRDTGFPVVARERIASSWESEFAALTRLTPSLALNSDVVALWKEHLRAAM